MMKCMTCGETLPEGTKVCPICGFPTADSPSEAGSEAAKQVAEDKLFGASSDDASKPDGEPKTENAKNKYQLVGGNAGSANPFGADPNNTAAKTFTEPVNPTIAKPTGYSAMTASAGGYDPLSQGGFDPAAPQPTGYDPRYTPPGGPVVQPKSSNANVGWIIVIAAAAVILFLIFFALFKGGKADGTYQFDHGEIGGLVVSKEQLKSMDSMSAYPIDDFTIEISGKKGTFGMAGRTASCDVDISGDKITLSQSGMSISGTIDTSAGKLTLEMGGAGLVFLKK